MAKKCKKHYSDMLRETPTYESKWSLYIIADAFDVPLQAKLDSFRQKNAQFDTKFQPEWQQKPSDS